MAAPVSQFIGNNLTPVAGVDLVSFTDQSTNVPTSRLWNFGDNIKSYYSGAYDLKLAKRFNMLAGTALTLTTFTAPSMILTGDIGETTLAGVAPIFGSGSDLGVTGDYAQALVDAASLYATLKALPGHAIITPGTLWADDYGAGVGVFTPGVYTTASAITMTAAKSITLSGDGDYVFVSTGGAITFGANDNIILTNGAKAERVFWIANNAITSGTTCILKGNFMS